MVSLIGNAGILVTVSDHSKTLFDRNVRRYSYNRSLKKSFSI